jgi:hypothetical protein
MTKEYQQGSGRYRARVDPYARRTMRSGLDLQEPGTLPPNTPMGDIYRAIVTKTYATDAPERTAGRRSSTTRKYEVECDIILTRSQVPYPRVPVMQRSHGVNDADLWIPRPATRVVGEPQDLTLRRVSERGTPEKVPPNFAFLDSDQVLVQFMEGDPTKPIIVGAMSHVKTNRLVTDGSGWSESAEGTDRGNPQTGERYTRFRGVEARVNEAGDVLLDTAGANPTDDDTEVPNPAVGGQVRVRVKRTQRLTVEFEGTDVLEIYVDPLTQEPRVDFVEGATEQFIRGTTHIGNMDTLVAATQTFADLAALASSTGAAASVGPLAPLKPAWIALGNAFAQWGGMTSPPADPGVLPVPPASAPLGVFKATLVDEIALSTKIRGD